MSLTSVVEALDFVSVPNLAEEEQFALLNIRNQQIIRESSYSSHIINEGEHLRWIERLETEPEISFYAVRYKEEIVGGVGLKVFDKENGKAEWSFYVSKETQGQGIGLALGIRALDLFFGEFGLQCVIGEALADNPASLSYHRRLGFRKVADKQRMVQPANKMADIVVFSLSPTDWNSVRTNLYRDA